jgi:hypothetical protein
MAGHAFNDGQAVEHCLRIAKGCQHRTVDLGYQA